MRRQAKLADVLRQRAFLGRRMLDGVRARRHLGEQERDDEEQVAQGIHGRNLIDLDEQTL